MRGWSMEARINAEDPAKGFLPQGGRVKRLHLPMGPHVRVDSHLFVGYEVPLHYDSMLMKLITHGRTRAEAAARMKRALQELIIEGCTTTASFHEALLRHPDFMKGDFSTGFLEKEKDYFEERLRNHLGGAPADLSALLASVLVLGKG